MSQSENSHALEPGTLVEEYRIESLLGEGGFGLTYLAFDTQLEKRVAIKEYLPAEFAHRTTERTVRPRAPNTEELFQWGLDTFINEARTLARFHNPHIVQVYRFIEANGTAYIVMEYIPGRELKAVVRELGRLTQDEVMAILLPIMDGLAEVHDAGILHRDIKPGNILIRDNGKPVLIDFGAARQAIGSKSRSITSIVTPGYAPIEQYSTKGSVGAWSDIYSLAAVAHYCLTLARPEDATDRMMDDHYLPLTEGAQNQATPEFLAAIDRALAILPADRPQSLDEWVRMLKAGPAETADSSATRVIAPNPPAEPASAHRSAPPDSLSGDVSSASAPSPAPIPASAPPKSADSKPGSMGNKVVGVESQENRLPLIGVLVATFAVLVLTFAVMLWMTDDTPQVAADDANPAAGNADSTGAAAEQPQSDAETTEPDEGQTSPQPDTDATAQVPSTTDTPQPAPAPTFGLYITTHPAGANVRVENMSQPYEYGMRLPAGDYQLTATLPDYLPASLRVTIRDTAVREVMQLQPDRSREEQMAYERARTERSQAAMDDYLRTFPSGPHHEEVRAWRETLLAEQREAELARQRERQQQAAQARWMNCEPLPNHTAGLTGRAFFDLGRLQDYSIRLGRFPVRDNAMRRVDGNDEQFAQCQTSHCIEVLGPFGWQSFTVETPAGVVMQGRACFHHLDSTPHVYRVTP